jgi:alpha-tubulin suppressor-like RCC1 family protein
VQRLRNNSGGHGGRGHVPGPPNGGGGIGGHGGPGNGPGVGHGGGLGGECDGGHGEHADSGSGVGADAASDATADGQVPIVTTSSSFSSASLQVEVRTDTCGDNIVANYFRVVNNGTTPIKLSDISLKYWAYDTTGIDLISRVQDGGHLRDASGAIHPVHDVSSSAVQFSPSCGTGVGNEANWEVAVSTTDPEELRPAAEWTHMLVTTSLASCGHFSPGTADWFSTCLAPSPDYETNPHYAIYYRGALVFTSTGINAPSCQSPHGTTYLTAYTLPPPSQVLGAVPSPSAIGVNVGLPLRNRAALETIINNAADPLSTTYRKWVSQSDFLANYSPLPTVYADLVAWAQGQGLRVTTYSNQLGIDVTGTAAQIERAFFVSLVLARRPDGTIFYAPDRAPSVNMSLPVTLEGMSGLDNYAVPVASTIQTGPGGYMDSTDLRNAYLGPDSGCQVLTGIGQSIGLVEPASFNPADVATYRASTGLSDASVLVKTIPCDGGLTAPSFDGSVPCRSQPENPAGAEIAIDIDVAMAMAPEAQIIAFTDSNVDSILALIADDPTVNQVSNSYWVSPASSHVETLLFALAAQGKSYFTASLDQGAYPLADAGCPSGGLAQIEAGAPAPDNLAELDFNNPVAQPFVTVVGGTQLSFETGMPQWTGEATWNQGGGIAGGGGVLGPSQGYPGVPIPSYQIGLASAFPSNPTISSVYRNLPDVAAVATGLTGYDSICTADGGGGATCPPSKLIAGQLFNADGTSASSPIWAGFAALMNEYAGKQGAPTVGFLNPAIYEMGMDSDQSRYAASFHDIQSGPNPNACSFSYTAQKGYDLATGWGSPTCGLITTITPSLPQAISAGGGFACAVTRAGGVECWGNNDFGQLGNGSSDAYSTTPVKVTGLGSGVAAVAAGAYSACALLQTGNVMCWGINELDELGAGSSPPSDTCNGFYYGITANFPCSRVPLPVASEPLNATALAVGAYSACVLTQGGGVECWGSDVYGGLGDSGAASEMCGALLEPISQTADYPCSSVPVPVSGLTSGAVSVSVGQEYACALTTNGAVSCWGRDDSGQLGYAGISAANARMECTSADGHPCQTIIPCSLVPEPVNGLASVSALSSSDFFSCGVTTASEVLCWGDNTYGELGMSPPSSCAGDCSQQNPVQVPGLIGSITELSAGASACVLGAATPGGVWCWGPDFTGELGNGSYNSGPSPVMVTGLTNTTTYGFSSGEGFACALTSNGQISCWGSNDYGQLGVGASPASLSSSDVPVTFTLQ